MHEILGAWLIFTVIVIIIIIVVNSIIPVMKYIINILIVILIIMTVLSLHLVETAVQRRSNAMRPVCVLQPELQCMPLLPQRLPR